MRRGQVCQVAPSAPVCVGDKSLGQVVVLVSPNCVFVCGMGDTGRPSPVGGCLVSHPPLTDVGGALYWAACHAILILLLAITEASIYHILELL